jgi:hypothetical protein
VNAQQQPDSSIASSQGPESAGSQGSKNPLTLKTVKTSGGTANFLPLWTNANTLGNSGLFQSSSGQLGLGTTTPAQALDLGNNNSMVIRVDPGNDTTEAIGGYSLVGRGAKGVPNTWWTLTAPVGGGFGVPVNSYSIWQYPPNSIPGCCLNRLTILPAEASTDTGGTMIIDQNGNLDQTRSSGGAVKAMLHFSGLSNTIISCFNSALSGAAATKPPCGFGVDVTGPGDYIFDFGFEVDDRIYSATTGSQTDGFKHTFQFVVSACGNQDGGCTHTDLTNNQVEVTVLDGDNNFQEAAFHLIIY